ncbi:MAG: HPr family phosphocarrier protein [Alphaproteobacteria bacterium]
MTEPQPPKVTESACAGLRRRLTICNERGLHARASARLVEVAGRFACTIRVRKNGFDVCATSIMGLLTLGAGCGQCIDLEADGPDAADALEAIAALVDSGFGEGKASQSPLTDITT